MMNNSEQIKPAPIADKQSQPSCRFSIQATLRGFPITIEGEGRAGDLKIIIDRLLSIGAEPPAATPSSVQTPEKKTASLCPVHGSAMKEGRRGFFCPKKVGDSYCKEVA
jgi:hypothetical protein